MQVKIQETTIIRPIKPPFEHNHTLSLSHIDTDRNLHVILRHIRVHAANPNQQNDPFHVITNALSKTLVHYYPLGGTLCFHKSDGRLELFCRLLDGVPVIKAYVDCELKDADVDGDLMEHLSPDPGFTRPLTLQVTRFKCSGFVLGAAVPHVVCDGTGATMFFNAMAEFARGADRVSIEPIWERSMLLGPRNPPRVQFPIRKFLCLNKDFVPYMDSGKRVVRESFIVKEGQLDQLKGVCFREAGLKFTTFEVLSAFIWRARTKASLVPRNEKVTLAYSMNIRKIVNPPLPIGYWGNGCIPFYVHLTAKELVEQPIWVTINLIRKTKFNAKDEYVRSFIDFQEMYYSEGITAGRRVSGFTDWRYLNNSTVDFGWGSPVKVVPISRYFLGSVEPCFFMPGNDGINVLLHLEEDTLSSFRKEMKKLSNKDDCVRSSL